MHKRIFFAALVAAVAVVCPARATISTTASSVTYTGNGATTAFTVPFKFLSASDLVVTVAGVMKALTTDYTVSGAGNSTGTVTFVAAPANAAAVVISRSVDGGNYKQTTSLRSQRTYDPSTVENALDKATMIAQELKAITVSPPASVLPANVTAKLNGIRFADQFANIQAAITDAGTTGAVIIPSNYVAGDTYTNPNGIDILDLRIGKGVTLPYVPSGTGAVTRTSQSKHSDNVSAKDFCGDSLPGDATTCLQAALTYTASINGTLWLPCGTYSVSSTLLVTGNQAGGTGETVVVRGCGMTGSTHATTIKWIGADATGTVLFKVNGVHRFSMFDLSLNGNSTAETLFYSTENSPTTYAGYGWQFNNVGFLKTRVNGRGFSIPDTTVNQSRYVFTNALFNTSTQNGVGALSPTGTVGFYSSNQNALDHLFIGCEFTQADYGIYVEGGSVKVYGTDFTQHAVADLFFHFNSNSEVSGSWSEQSRQFVIGANAATPAPLTHLTISDSRIQSYPWAYWKHFESTRTQPTNDYTQWVAISWDRPAALNLIGTSLSDPYLGAIQGVAAPTTSSTPTVLKPNAITSPMDVNIIGSTSSTLLASPTQQFVMLGSANAAPKVAIRKRYLAASVGATATVDIANSTVTELTLTANTTITLDTTHADAGDMMTLIFKQDGTGGRTTGFVNVNLLNGAFAPLLAANTRSSLTVQFNGTAWDEVTRSGAHAPPPTTFANLGTPANGVVLYCSDCTIANPCAGAGTGAIAKRLNGVWVCN
jgi:hypothetical protein